MKRILLGKWQTCHNVTLHAEDMALARMASDSLQRINSGPLLTAEQIIEDAAVHEQYCRVITPEPAINDETEEVTFLLQQCLELR